MLELVKDGEKIEPQVEDGPPPTPHDALIIALKRASLYQSVVVIAGDEFGVSEIRHTLASRADAHRLVAASARLLALGPTDTTTEHPA